MRWYRGPNQGDRPIGGGSYNRQKLGHEAFNFLPIDGYVLGYFQPLIRTGHPSTIALDRVEAAFSGTELDGVLVIFVATDPRRGRQRIIGWFRDATVYRCAQPSRATERNEFSYYVKALSQNAILIPEANRTFPIPGGKGGFGQANVCYTLGIDGEPKDLHWIDDALRHVESYSLENIAHEPESEADRTLEETIAAVIENGAGYQSDPRIRRAIEEYAMQRASKHLEGLGYKPADKHRTESYDFLCDVAGEQLYVEVKGTQASGSSVSLTPKEVEHARKHKNSALFIVHSVTVKGKKNPKVSGGKELFLCPWDILAGTLKPRAFVFTLSKRQDGF